MLIAIFVLSTVLLIDNGLNESFNGTSVFMIALFVLSLVQLCIS